MDIKLVKRGIYALVISWLVVGANLWHYFGDDYTILIGSITELIAGAYFCLTLWPNKNDSIKIWFTKKRITKHHLIIVLMFILITNFIEEAVLVMVNDTGISYLQGILWLLSLSLTSWLLFKTNINYSKLSKHTN